MSDSTEIELVPSMNIVGSDSGVFHITPKDLTEKSADFWYMFSEAFHRMQEKHPEFEFEVEDRVFDGGIDIKWRRYEPKANGEGNNGPVRPELDS